MFIGIAINLTARLLSSASPAALFANGEVGLWYDPSDLTTLFQDAAGTTPVTAAGQPVGLMLDKSKGLALGAELVTNGTFDTNLTGWTNTGNGVAVWESGAARWSTAVADFSGFRSAAFSTVVGRTYTLTASVLENTGAAWRIVLINGDGSFSNGSENFTTVGTRTVRFVATQTTSFVEIRNGTGATANRLIDSVSVKLLDGNHATQSTAASRPTYGINPITGTRNISPQSTADTLWQTAGLTPPTLLLQQTYLGLPCSSVTFAGGTLGGFSTSRAERLVSGATYNITSGVSYVMSVEVSISRQLAAGESFQIFQTGVSGINSITLDSANTATLVGAWQRLSSASATSTATGQNYPVIFPNTLVSATPVTVYVRAIQVEIGSTATAYQRVTTRYDVTEAGVQSVQYLQFDGVDDGMVTGTITPESALIPTGPELVTNGDFSNGTTGWTAQSGWTLGSGVATVNSLLAGSTYLRTSEYSAVAGTYYRVNFTVTSYTSGNIFAAAGSDISATAATATGTYSFLVRAGGTGGVGLYASSTNTIATIDNISVREVSGAANKVQVFAGVRKLSDALVGSVAEFSSNLNSNNGSMWLAAPVTNGGANYYFASKGTIASAGSIASPLAAPLTSVLTGIGDISADVSTLRVNSSQVFTSATDQGTGNYLAYPLYLGRRGGATAPYNGRLYSLIVRFGANLTDGQITSTETWVNAKTGAY